MKKITALILCAIAILSLFFSCKKETDPAKLLPGSIWDNHTAYISISFDIDGTCVLSNAISQEKCTYTVENDKITIKGELSTWQGTLTLDNIVIEEMEGNFVKTKERTYFGSVDGYGNLISTLEPDSEDEYEEGAIHDLSFWYG